VRPEQAGGHSQSLFFGYRVPGDWGAVIISKMVHGCTPGIYRKKTAAPEGAAGEVIEPVVHPFVV